MSYILRPVLFGWRNQGGWVCWNKRQILGKNGIGNVAKEITYSNQV